MNSERKSLEISGRTKLLVLIGDPISQSRGPSMVNERLNALGCEVAMLPLHVAAVDLGPTISGLRGVQNFVGAFVTMPHKKAIVGHLDEIEDAAHSVGAANIVRRDADCRLIGSNFDGEGFVRGLLSAGTSVDGKSCLLFGAGGAAKAIAFALGRHGCVELAIANRTAGAADEIISRLEVGSAKMVTRRWAGEVRPFDIVINATSVGMKAADTSLIPAELVKRAGLAAEIIIAPELTPLLRMAQELGRPIHKGAAMLEAQLELAFRFWGVASKEPSHDST